MKVFNLVREDVLSTRSSTDGYQLKAIKGSNFIKSQAKLGGYLVDDWMVERLASKFGIDLGIPIVQQEACDINLKGKNFKGVYSRDFGLDGYQFISFRRLLERYNIDGNCMVKMSIQGRVNFVCRVLCRAGLSKQDAQSYVHDMMLLDLLVLNVDRHLSNFGVFVRNGVICRALLFDNGMGMFENDIRFYDMSDFRKAMEYCYFEPWGINVQEMTAYLKGAGVIGSRILNIKNYRRSSFPNDMAYDYFKYITRVLRR